jgi:hypothetical protein
MAGRRPQSPELRLLKGNPSGKPIPENVPAAVQGRPQKPTELTGTAAEHWDYLAELLESEHRLTLSDGPLLMAAAIAYAIGMKLTLAIMDPNLPTWIVYERPEPDGNLRQEVDKHPIFSEERSQWERYRKCVNDLCLSAGTRAKARTPTGAQPKSKIDAFAARPH